MAEKERFELSVLAYTRVPGVHLKPLGHLSLMAGQADRKNHHGLADQREAFSKP